MDSVITLENLVVSFDTQTRVLDLPKLEIGRGERVFVLGRSGSGKTTLARLIKGRVAPTVGRVTVLGAEPLARDVQRRVAMIDQAYYLVPRVSVIGNVLIGALGRVSAWRSLIGWYPAAEWEKAEAILREVELDGFGSRRVETLSGGQQQRVAIARALMQESDIILADEPISSLDPELAEDALRLLVDCAQRRDVTLIVNLHQPALAAKFATRLMGLVEGRIVYDGSPEKFTDETADLIYRNGGSVDILSAGSGLEARATSEEVTNDDAAATVAEKTRRPNLRLLGR